MNKERECAIEKIAEDYLGFNSKGVDNLQKSIRPIVLAAYYDGVREGLRRYAWWKEGVEYVGSCGTTLKTALAHVDAEERGAIGS